MPTQFCFFGNPRNQLLLSCFAPSHSLVHILHASVGYFNYLWHNVRLRSLVLIVNHMLTLRSRIFCLFKKQIIILKQKSSLRVFIYIYRTPLFTTQGMKYLFHTRAKPLAPTRARGSRPPGSRTFSSAPAASAVPWCRVTERPALGFFLLRPHVLLRFFGRCCVHTFCCSFLGASLYQFYAIFSLLKNVGQGSDGLGPKVRCVAQW